MPPFTPRRERASGKALAFVGTDPTKCPQLPSDRHPTGIADSTFPSPWSNADFRRANIDTLSRRLHKPLPRGGVAAEQVVCELAVDVIDGLHSTASGRFFAWVIGGALSAALRSGWLAPAWGQKALYFVSRHAPAGVWES